MGQLRFGQLDEETADIYRDLQNATDVLRMHKIVYNEYIVKAEVYGILSEYAQKINLKDTYGEILREALPPSKIKKAANNIESAKRNLEKVITRFDKFLEERN